MNYKGTIIEESLEDTNVLKDMKTISTDIEKVTPEHKTPWIKQWTLHMVEIPENMAANMAVKLSKSLDGKHCNWYADFKNSGKHYIIFRDKIFLVDRDNKSQYDEVLKYGISIGVPAYQLDFSPDIK
jgi:hypothetical protein